MPLFSKSYFWGHGILIFHRRPIKLRHVPTWPKLMTGTLSSNSKYQTINYIVTYSIIITNICGRLAVHGGWSTWGKWSTCSASCGQGLTHRRRTCTNPRPSYNGNYCFGDPTEYAMCLVKKCTGIGFICAATRETRSSV